MKGVTSYSIVLLYVQIAKFFVFDFPPSLTKFTVAEAGRYPPDDAGHMMTADSVLIG
jgi:hypothetical protein